MQRDELVGKLRLLKRGAFELLGGQGGCGEERIGGRLAQRTRAAIAGFGGDFLPFERKELLQPIEQRRRQRPIVMLDLAEIGGGDTQLCREVGLPDRAGFAQAAELATGKKAARLHGTMIVCKYVLCNFANSHLHPRRHQGRRR